MSAEYQTFRGRFGTALYDVRTQQRLSQSGLARQAGYDHSFISRLELGQRMPSRDVVRRLCAVLGCDEIQHTRLMLAAGYAPDGRDLPAIAEMLAPVLAELEQALAGVKAAMALVEGLRMNGAPGA